MLQVVSCIIFLISAWIYVQGIRSGKTIAPIASWVIWATLDLITLGTLINRGTVNGLAIGALTGSLSTVIFSLKYGTKGWTIVDSICMTCAVVSISLWQVFDSPPLALLMALLAMVIGVIPTLTWGWKAPYDENETSWRVSTVSGLISLIAIPRWWTYFEASWTDTFILDEVVMNASQPIVIFLIEVSVITVLFIRKRMLPKP